MRGNLPLPIGQPDFFRHSCFAITRVKLRVDRTRSNSMPLRYDQIALLVVPAISKPDPERWRIALLEQLLQFCLIMLFEELDRTEVRAEEPEGPLLAIKIGQWNSGIILHNQIAVVENEIADRGETLLEHE